MSLLDRIQRGAHRLLDVVVAGYATAAVDLPTRRYVTTGLPVHDGEQVTVHLVSVAMRTSFRAAARPVLTPGHPTGAPFPGPLYEIQVVRCVPVSGDEGEPPTVEELGASGDLHLLDAGLLAITLGQAATSGALRLDDIPEPMRVEIGPISTLGPGGGLAGVACRATMELL